MKLATIQRIHSIKNHPNADTLSIAKVMEWPVVIKKNQFVENELIIFIEIDSIVPKENSYFSFMEKQKYRIWNAKFRGCPSSGLVCPLSILGEGNWKDGDDVTDILGIIKYERPIDITIGGDAAGGFPTHLISITDEDNALSHPTAFDELINGQELYITLKNDGSSTSFIFNNGEFSACSRKLELKRGSGFPWQIATKYNLEEKLIKYKKNIALQGETVGEKLNSNRLGLKDIQFKLFKAKNLDSMELYNYTNLKKLSNDLEIPIVEEIMVINFDKNIHTFEWFQTLANKQVWPTNGQSAEGIVISCTIPMYSYILQKSWSVKIISQLYK